VKKIPLVPFRPALWAPTGHLQTYLALVGRPHGGQIPHHMRILTLEDGDQLILRISGPAGFADPSALRHPLAAAAGALDHSPVCVLFHGLGGDSESPYMLRIGAKLNKKGFTVIRFNHRGCAPEGFRRARQIYHAGRTDDIDATLKDAARLFPGRPLLAIGFSLSANMLLLFLAQKGEARDHPHLRAALAVNPPMDLSSCAKLLAHPRNRLIDRYFTATLLRAARRRAAWLKRDGIAEHTAVDFHRINSLRTFDTYFTAPLAGYGSCEEYYAKNSSRPLIEHIRLPASILTAADDPIIPRELFDDLSPSPFVHCHMESAGGHLGYLSHKKTHHGDRRWLDDYVVHWVQTQSTLLPELRT